jgi:acyl-CoA synthetase (AMP-forming)/AMP-acid ligase II
MRIVDFLDRGAYQHPDRVFCTDAQQAVTYAQMQAWSHQVAAQLIEADFAEGARVGCLAPNCNAVMAHVYGMNRAGAVWVPLNARNSEQENLSIVQDFDVDCVLFHPRYERMVETFKTAATQVRHFIRMDLQPAAAGQPVPRLLFEPSRLTGLFPTGGTTGRSKGVMLTELNWMVKAANIAAALPVDAPPVHLVIAPLTHGAGSFAMSLTAQGATHVILEGFNAVEVMQAIEQHRVTHLFLPPTALYALLAHPDVRKHDYTSLRYFLYGAAPSSPQKIEEAISVFGPVMTNGYGQTEAPGSMSFLHPRDHQPSDPARKARMRSCGQPTVLTEMRIVAADGAPQAPHQPGEIEVRGPLVMAGYYKNPEATAAALHDGWLRTGDVGYVDEEGYYFIVDRTKDMIISGGFNVYPAEVEQVAAGFDGVQDCAVIGVPDEKWGEAVTLVVQPKPGHAIDADALLAYCRERLGGVKAPKSVQIWPDLPRSAVGKVLKRDIRQRFWQHTERRI